jgi:hypothetical protein
VPFYKYRALWRHHQTELVNSGVRVAPLLLFGGQAAKLFPEIAAAADAVKGKYGAESCKTK